jgi:hypothetical protein
VFPSYVLLQREQYKNICNKEKNAKTNDWSKNQGKREKEKKE